MISWYFSCLSLPQDDIVFIGQAHRRFDRFFAVGDGDGFLVVEKLAPTPCLSVSRGIFAAWIVGRGIHFILLAGNYLLRALGLVGRRRSHYGNDLYSCPRRSFASRGQHIRKGVGMHIINNAGDLIRLLIR